MGWGEQLIALSHFKGVSLVLGGKLNALLGLLLIDKSPLNGLPEKIQCLRIGGQMQFPSGRKKLDPQWPIVAFHFLEDKSVLRQRSYFGKNPASN